MTKRTWDGVTSEIVLSKEGNPLVLLCGHPRNTAQSNWAAQVTEPASLLVQEASGALYDNKPFQGTYYGKREKAKWKSNERRGTHRAETVGVGMGGGQTKPAHFAYDAVQLAVMVALLATEPFQRIIGFVNCMFKSHAGGLYDYYRCTLDALFDEQPTLPRLFAPQLSIFPSITLNLGPQTATLPHLDLLNLAWGWCFITALGWFDPTRSALLVLWDLGMAIEFPPGSTIAIPSALLRHSNTSLAPGETRYSLTQFAAGGLFRYAENGFQLQQEFLAGLTAEELEARAEVDAERFREGIKMYTNIN
ncbi:hypothetical protein HMN09_01134500 [Mycena chlorophos]|uniref:Uncharacterized protein n=1 Tax=Mycena chlorophos TaxID=658473 RepID=A0A8H6SBW8_MYCCL|nr:hypothetical protein HMN09_01134500 [Mycena chlorophos]